MLKHPAVICARTGPRATTIKSSASIHPEIIGCVEQAKQSGKYEKVIALHRRNGSFIMESQSQGVCRRRAPKRSLSQRFHIRSAGGVREMIPITFAAETLLGRVEDFRSWDAHHRRDCLAAGSRPPRASCECRGREWCRILTRVG